MTSLRHIVRAAIAGLAALVASHATAGAEGAQDAPEAWWGAISGSVTGTSDYVFRGLSQTRGQPAAQLSLEYAHGLPTGGLSVYAGTFLSNTRFVDTSSSKNLPIRMEQDLDVGLRGPVPGIADLTWDVGYIRYRYPGSDSMPVANNASPDWAEGYVKLDYDATVAVVHAQTYHSQKYSTEGGPANYLSLGTDVPLQVWDLVATAHVGHLQLDNGANVGYHSYTDWALGFSRTLPDLFGVNVSVTYYDSDLAKGPMTAQSLGLGADPYDRIHETANARVVFAVSKCF